MPTDLNGAFSIMYRCSLLVVVTLLLLNMDRNTNIRISALDLTKLSADRILRLQWGLRS